MNYNAPWESDFPPVYYHTSVSFLKSCAGYYKAKQGDCISAVNTVDECVKPDIINRLKKEYPRAVLLPVLTDTDNRLPAAFAERIGLRVHYGIYAACNIRRKTLSGLERILFSPVFTGDVIKGAQYIIVDDVVTQGGTISALRRFVMRGGATVAAVTALACSAGSVCLSPESGLIERIINKFEADELTEILNRYALAESIHELTNSQVKYLLRYKNIKKLNHRIKMLLK